MKKMMYAAALAALFAAPAAAQSADAAPLRRNLITANPIGILADYYNAEFEHALNDVWSVSLAGEHSSVDDTELTAADVRFRYYPQARMFSGLALGASLGFASFTEGEEFVIETPNGPRYEFRDVEHTGPTLGLQLDYSWLLGRDRRLFVGLGFGVRRVLGAADHNNAPGEFDDDDGPTLLPGGRYLGIGYTF